VPESILTVLKLLFLALLYLFFFRVLRAVWVETHEPKPEAAPRPRRGGGAAAAPAVTAGRLRVIAPPERKGVVFELGDEVTVGRASGCQVSLADDTTVSQLHARVFRRDGKLLVEDLGSTNGSFLNRRPVTGAMPLRRGDRLQFGQTVLEVVR
jgi:pSer/pThr/pTyr-binding forkhead associated (FHA) protein